MRPLDRPEVASSPAVTEESVWAKLAEVTDPEIPVSLVDLGTIYRVEVEDGSVEIDLTFTSIGCPAMEMILEDVGEAVGSLPGVERVAVEIVWSPPWTKDRLTPRGRRLLAATGLSL
ncbi:MAG: metal-sulfur cluster assembly factor [Gemmatimonadota bacterium]|nr:metal-sulfur cluster assembly factor [Gemmatimonadota bacterium]